MSTEIRPPAHEAEVAAWFASEAAGFGGRVDPEFVAAEQTVLPPERMLAVWADGRPIANGGYYPFELTLPGGRATVVTGVCDVAVLPGHRRQGHLTRIMQRLHSDARERGEVAAVLTASAGSIYHRFGYGIATSHLIWQLDTAHAAMIDAPAVDLHVDHVAGVDGAEALADLWARCRFQRPGTLSRSLEWWRLVIGPHEHWKGGGTVTSLLLRDHEGMVRGAAPYRLTQTVDRGVQQWTVEPLEVVADSPEVEAQIWVELGRLDHVSRIAPRVRPLDDPLRWRLVDPRRLVVGGVVDLLWVCPIDVPGLLAARTYATETSVLFAVEDPFDPEVDGHYRLDTSPDGATCLRVEGAVDPDLRLSASVLGSVVLGGSTFTAFARAGRVDELRPGALAATDAAFSSPLAPFNSTFF